MLLTATDEQITECIDSPWAGVLTFVIRVAGVRVPEKSKGCELSKAHGRVEEELLATVRLALDRGLSPNQPALWAEAEIFTPPLVAAASYDFEKVVALLLERDADPMQRNSDAEVAMHVSVADLIQPPRHPLTIACSRRRRPLSIARARFDASWHCPVTHAPNASARQIGAVARRWWPRCFVSSTSPSMHKPVGRWQRLGR